MTFLDQPANLTAAFARAAAQHPARDAIVAADITLTYDKLWLIVQSFALRMQSEGIDRKAVVAVKSTDMIASVAVMFASAAIGSGFVVWEDRLLSDGVVRPTHVLRSPDVAAPDQIASTLMDPSWSPLNFPVPKDAASHFPGYDKAETPWWYLHTSGTTGSPKYLALSQRMALDRSRAVSGDFQAGETRFTSLFPCTARPFFVRAMAALTLGSTIVDTIDPAFMQAQKVTLVCGSPRQSKLWLDSGKLSSRLLLLQISGARFSQELAAEMLGAFQKVEDVYGSSETNKTYVNAQTLDEGLVVTRGCAQDSTIQIRHPDGSLCGSDEVGEVFVRNGYMIAGYIDAPDATKRAFHDGWFRPGDMGHWDTNGVLCIDGRVDELINLDGLKIDPVAVDEALRVPGVRLAACFRDPDGAPRLLAFVELETSQDPEPLVRAAMARCSKLLSPSRTPALIYVVPQIPVTHDGVPRRRECERLARDMPKQGL
jgi:acyl-coenzyme A synthetase/AMP-(fatty) acid ligase